MIQSRINQVISLAGMLGRGVRTEAERAERLQVKAEATEKKAQEALKKEQERKRKTRRNFLQYMQDEPTNLGVKFGQLPKATQKELAKEYTKKQRKEIMDRKDAVK